MVNSIKLKLYYASKAVLSQKRRNQIKQWLGSRRKKWAGLYVLRHGRFGAKDLIGEIDRRLKNDFEILMVHSAYDRLLPMCSAKPQELVRELVDYCGPKRTLVMPAFVLGGAAGPLEYYRTRPFDVRRTPSEMGMLTEYFRRWPGVQRSLHPTHSVCAIGPLAQVLTASHHLAGTPSGKGTPFEFLARNRAVVIGLGVEYYRSLTQIHAAEHLLGDEFPIEFRKVCRPLTLIDASGAKLPCELTVFQTDTELNATLLRSILPREFLQEWKFKGTPLYFTFADQVTSYLMDAARRGETVYGRVPRPQLAPGGLNRSADSNTLSLETASPGKELAKA
jgi:aminoglycoside N3'-acetyltransferase